MNHDHIALRRAVRVLAAAACLACAPAQAAVITFEEALPSSADFFRLTSYMDFTWSDGSGGSFADIFVLDVPAFGGSLQPGFTAGLISTKHVAFKAAGNDPDAALSTSRILSTTESFILESGYFTASTGTQTLTFTGYKTGAQKYSASRVITSSTPTLVSFTGWVDIDELRITTDTPSLQWILDDFAFTRPVPEPGSWALLAAGLSAAALGFARRARR
jgi:hypothetical protein